MNIFKKKKKIEIARKRQDASRAILHKTDFVCKGCGEPLTVGNLNASIFSFNTFAHICVKCKVRECIK